METKINKHHVTCTSQTMFYHKKWPIHLWFQLFQQRFAKSVALIAPLHPLLPRFISRTGACRPPWASSHVVSLPASSDPLSRYISRYIWGEIGTHDEACTCFRSHHRTVEWTNPKIKQTTCAREANIGHQPSLVPSTNLRYPSILLGTPIFRPNPMVISV